MELQALADKIREGNIRAIGKGITLIESRKPEHAERAARLLELLLPHAGQSLRVGITGVPGVGKSTFIESFGSYLTEQGHKVAVLAVDPSSQISGGSILGDKTRMEELSRNPRAFIRPSPAGDTLGGVARRTRETMLLCEAAGYDVVIVETVGVGQSETTVASMVDFFMLLQLATAGDELQGIKKGVMELADAILINKADIDRAKTELARRQYENALHILRPKSRNWAVPVQTVSALNHEGVPEVWEMLSRFRRTMKESGEFDGNRRRQSVDWMWSLVMDDLKQLFLQHNDVQGMFPQVQEAVSRGITTPSVAARRLLNVFRR
ncbi:methylmalonyl Co-A mutase-associated GTPase MeaB [Trichlorobacter ammonificans]|uniref:Methylmalonyl-CoA mutase-interacting GTPase YgfD n=1 Tax=Trichlorobacter ammonificans TaxID=2916410 RepID=A0ABM9DB25_9BACT|nr:methylmalonyl Co-A mutase-associated GTPase MeaB [Trichlorobacter ammonificans]CAH2032446.1 methylmalonyl-CoA mutase-interacting GTPase YgfD [Trichlorobacter ammonificans]